MFWQSIADSVNPAMFEAYLAQFPNGVFRLLAEARLAELRPPRRAMHPVRAGREGVVPGRRRPERAGSPPCRRIRRRGPDAGSGATGVRPETRRRRVSIGVDGMECKHETTGGETAPVRLGTGGGVPDGLDELGSGSVRHRAAGDAGADQPGFLGGNRVGKHEVTQAEWQGVMRSNLSHFSGCGQCPVEQVSWNDAQELIG